MRVSWNLKLNLEFKSLFLYFIIVVNTQQTAKVDGVAESFDRGKNDNNYLRLMRTIVSNVRQNVLITHSLTHLIQSYDLNAINCLWHVRHGVVHEK